MRTLTTLSFAGRRHRMIAKWLVLCSVSVIPLIFLRRFRDFASIFMALMFFTFYLPPFTGIYRDVCVDCTP